MIRREFLAAGIGGLTATLLKAQPHEQFPTEPRKRLSVATYPFRSVIASSRNKTGMSLDEFAGTIVSKFDVRGIEPLSHHFESTEPGYIGKLKQGFDRAGIHVVDIPLDIGVNLCSADASERDEAYTRYAKWVDAAALLGSPSIRVHLPPPPMTPNYIDCSVAGLKRVSGYGEQKNIVVNLENDNPKTEDPFRIVEVIKRVNSPYLRALPDFCNSMMIKDSLEYNNKGLAAMFPHAYNISHVKDEEVDGTKVYRVDVQKIFAIAKQANYHGYFSMEFEGAGDPYEGTKKLLAQSIKYLS